MIELKKRIQTLFNSEPNSELDYYALSLFLAEKGTPSYSCFSGWVGFTDDKPPREIREASLVHADRMLNTWRKLVEPAMVIESATDFRLYFAFGGHALIEKQLAEIVIPDWLAPCTVVNVGANGFVSPTSLPATAMQRVPSKKLRMQILKRRRPPNFQ